MAAPRTHSLTRDEILTKALEIVDTEGLDALTMRHLARGLGVEAMTLYHHFPNKEAILDGVAEAVIAGMRLPEPLPEDWMDILVSLCMGFRNALSEHPNVIPVLMTRPMSPPADAAVTPATVLLSAGFEPERMLEMYHSLMALTFGHAVISATAATGGSPLATGDDAFRHAVRILIAGYAEEERQRTARGETR